MEGTEAIGDPKDVLLAENGTLFVSDEASHLGGFWLKKRSFTEFMGYLWFIHLYRYISIFMIGVFTTGLRNDSRNMAVFHFTSQGSRKSVKLPWDLLCGLL